MQENKLCARLKIKMFVIKMLTLQIIAFRNNEYTFKKILKLMYEI